MSLSLRGGAAPKEAAPGAGLMRRLGRTSLLAFGVQVAAVGATYAANLVAARLVGAVQYGDYSFVCASMTILGYLAALGYDSALVRWLPTHIEHRSWPALAATVAFVERRVAAMAGVLVAGGLVLTGVALTQHARAPLAVFALGFLLVPIWSMLLIRCATIRAFGQVVVALACDRLFRDGGILLVLGVLLLFPPLALDAVALMGVTVATSVVALACATRIARRISHPDPRCETGRIDARQLRRGAHPFLALVIAEVLINRCGVLVLGSFGRPQEAGCFALILNLAALVLLPRLAVNALLTPLIATFHARRDHGSLAQVVGTTSLWSLMGALAIGGVIWVTSPVLLGWYGPSFLAGRMPLAILLLGQVVASSAGAQLQLLKMSGREIDAAKILTASLAAQVILGVVLVPRLGLMGAALANLGCLLVWNLSMMPVVWRHLGIRPGVFRWPGSTGSTPRA